MVVQLLMVVMKPYFHLKKNFVQPRLEGKTTFGDENEFRIYHN